MKKVLFCLTVAAMALAVSCTKGEDGYYESATEADYGKGEGEYAYDPTAPSGDYGEGTADSGIGGENGGGGEAGVLTAAEWNDLANWEFWTNVMNNQEWNNSFEVWKMDTSSRIAIRVKDSAGNPVVNLPVALYQNQSCLWAAKTSVKGEANCWFRLFPENTESAEGLVLKIGEQMQVGQPVFSTGKGEEPVVWNEYVATATTPQKKADIAFIVDATGSMGDEIAFLKEDLLSILTSVQQSQAGVEIRTGAVFYRDEGDKYVTRYDDFTTNISNTMQFIGKQDAEGGGDLPEAVHTALETTLQKLSWNPEARSRIAFLILDAPAHYNHQGVVESIHQSLKAFAEQGIHIIPVLASNMDKTSEFMCRYFAIVTDGTYVFLTDDSGVGGSHLTPTVGQYTVEKLNDLLVRLINENI